MACNRIKQSFLKDKNIKVINNGIDTQNIFSRREYEQLKLKHNINNEILVLSVAPKIMSNFKGGHWVLKLAQRFINRENIKFLLIGVEGSKYQFDKNVIMLGRINDKIELASYYSMADITLITTKKETFSLVCVESLACGTPILGFESGAPSEIVPSGYGYFVPYGDLDSLVNALENIIDNKIKFKSTNECIAYAKEKYDKDIAFKNYMELYNQTNLNK